MANSLSSSRVRAAISDGLLSIGTLAVSATAEKFKTTTTAYYRINGIQYSKAATDNLTFTAAHVVTALKYGVILLQINAAGTISSKVPAATATTAMAYESAALAAAAKPAVDTGNVELGSFVIQAGAADWDANTDDMTAASDLVAITITDGTIVVSLTSLS